MRDKVLKLCRRLKKCTLSDLVSLTEEKEDIISFASLRDLLGTSRRSAKPVMAYLDNRGITAWSGKETERKKKA